jgi:hypothetical protein
MRLLPCSPHDDNAEVLNYKSNFFDRSQMKSLISAADCGKTPRPKESRMQELKHLSSDIVFLETQKKRNLTVKTEVDRLMQIRNSDFWH